MPPTTLSQSQQVSTRFKAACLATLLNSHWTHTRTVVARLMIHLHRHTVWLGWRGIPNQSWAWSKHMTTTWDPAVRSAWVSRRANSISDKSASTVSLKRERLFQSQPKLVIKQRLRLERLRKSNPKFKSKVIKFLNWMMQWWARSIWRTWRSLGS